MKIKEKTTKIIGSIADHSSGDYMDYVTVAMLQPSDSTLIDGATTHNQGKFVLETTEKGKYILRFSFIGFENKYVDIDIKNRVWKLIWGPLS